VPFSHNPKYKIGHLLWTIPPPPFKNFAKTFPPLCRHSDRFRLFFPPSSPRGRRLFFSYLFLVDRSAYCLGWVFSPVCTNSSFPSAWLPAPPLSCVCPNCDRWFRFFLHGPSVSLVSTRSRVSQHAIRTIPPPSLFLGSKKKSLFFTCYPPPLPPPLACALLYPCLRSRRAFIHYLFMLRGFFFQTFC